MFDYAEYCAWQSTSQGVGSVPQCIIDEYTSIKIHEHRHVLLPWTYKNI